MPTIFSSSVTSTAPVLPSHITCKASKTVAEAGTVYIFASAFSSISFLTVVMAELLWFVWRRINDGFTRRLVSFESLDQCAIRGDKVKLDRHLANCMRRA